MNGKKKKQSSPNIKKEDKILVKGYRPFEKIDILPRIYAFLVDIVVMLLPVALWNILFLAIFGSIVSINGIKTMSTIIVVLLIISILLVNNYIYAQTKGQSLGKKMFGFRVITMNGKVAMKRRLLIRELFGFDLPFLVLFYFTNIFGVMAYWFLNGLVVLFDPKHRSIIDFVSGTRVVTYDPSLMSAPAVEKQPVKQQIKQVQKVIKEPDTTIDLHIHSNFSANGEYNVEEIFQKARDLGLKTISITDLDCAKSITIAQRMSLLYHVDYVPGIEINSDLHGRRVRVIGYFVDYPHELYNQIENDSLINEKQASIERVRKFENIIGIQVPVEVLLKNNRFQRIPGEMIAEYVLNQPEYRKSPLLQPYLSGSKSLEPCHEMAKDFFAYGKLCYVPVKYPDIRDVLDVIHLTNGIAVLAHPGKLLAHEPVLLNEVLRMDIDGIEVFHPSHTKEDTTELLKLAMDKKLFVSAGSDFYRTGRDERIGKTGCPKDGEKIVELFVNARG